MFLYNAPTFVQTGNRAMNRGRMMFLGIIVGVIVTEDDGTLHTPTPKQKKMAIGRQVMNLGVVLRAATVREVAAKIIAHAK